MITTLDDIRDFNNVLQNFKYKIILLNFHESECESCKLFLPTLKKLSSEYMKDIKIVNVDIENNEEISSRFRVKKTPHILFIKNREIIFKMTEIPSEKELRNHLEITLNIE